MNRIRKIVISVRENYKRGLSLSLLILAWIISMGTSGSDPFYDPVIEEFTGDFTIEVEISDSCVSNFSFDQPVASFQLSTEDEPIFRVDCNGYDLLSGLWVDSLGELGLEMDFDNVNGSFGDGGSPSDTLSDAGSSLIICHYEIFSNWPLLTGPDGECDDTFFAVAQTSQGLGATVTYTQSYVTYEDVGCTGLRDKEVVNTFDSQEEGQADGGASGGGSRM